MMASSGATAARVLIPASLDTKSEAVGYLCDRLRSFGVCPVVVDCGVLGTPGMSADVTREEVARLAGTTIDSLRQAADRAAAIPAMILGLQRLVGRMHAEGSVAGCMGLGGGTNAAFAAAVFDLLPFGMPKMLVSTVASGHTASFVKGNDVLLYHSVVDVLGVNSILRVVLDQAAAAMAAMMCQAVQPAAAGDQTTVGMTVFGSTTLAAMAAEDALRVKGFEVLPFHARGVGGQAMEALVRAGRIHAVLDLTTTEIADEIAGGILSAGPHRLEAAAAAGIPQVVLPGAIDMVNFGAPATVPPRYAGRRFLAHSPHATLMRTTVDENRAIARFIGGKLNAATGPVEVVIPALGFSAYDRSGQPFFDPQADSAFRETLVESLRAGIPVHVLDVHINDADCVAFALKRLTALLDARRAPAVGTEA